MARLTEVRDMMISEVPQLPEHLQDVGRFAERLLVLLEMAARFNDKDLITELGECLSTDQLDSADRIAGEILLEQVSSGVLAESQR